MPTMPSGFTPVVSGYSNAGPNGVIRTEVAGGASRYSLDWDRGTQNFNCTLVLDKLQYGVWVAFYHYTIQKGTIAFDMQLDSGFGAATHSVNIVPGSYTMARNVGTHVTVTFVVEAESGAYSLSDGAVAAYGLTADSMPAGFKPVLSGYSHDGPGGAMRDDIVGGVLGYGLDWDGGVQRFNCTLILTATQYRTWAVWYHRLINKGALSFEMPLDSGFGTDQHLVNIIPGTYSATRNGNLTIVSFAVEGESKVYELGSDGAEALIALYGEYGLAGSSLLDRISTFANFDTLVLDL